MSPTLLLAVPGWSFVFAMLYAASYYEGGARGRAAVAPAAFLFGCMAPVPALLLAVSFVSQSAERSLLLGASRLAPSLHADSPGAFPSPCGFATWLGAAPPPAPAAPQLILACATAFELLLLCEAAHRCCTLAQLPSRAARRRLNATLAEVALHAAGSLSHCLAVAAGVHAAVLFLLPDLAVLGETFGFHREARVFRFSLRAAVIVVLTTLTWDAGCVAAPPPALLVRLYLGSAWVWRGLSAVAGCMALLRPHRLGFL